MTALKMGWVIFVITAAVAAYYIGTAPAGIEIPVHWGIDGTPDRYGSVTEGMATPPGVMLLVLTIMSVLKWLEPRQENLKRSNKARGWIALAVVMLMAVLEVGNVFIVEGHDVPMTRVVFVGVGLMFVIMGNFFGKIRSNFFIGVRTPWTLSSDEVWRQTHRLSGKIFMLAGALLMPVAWIAPEGWLFYTMLFVMIPTILTPLVYSWWLWKKEQN